MKNLLIFVPVLFSCFGLQLHSQSTDQIVQNGGFESGNISYPTGSNQMGNCNYWIASMGTSDWYTTQSYSDAFRGPCPLQSTSTQYFEDEVRNAQPKISTHDGSQFYAGFGTGEGMMNTLSRKTYKESRVKVSFWFSPRGPVSWPADLFIYVRLKDNTTNTALKTIVTLQTQAQSTQLYTPCTWYYFESGWIDTGTAEYDEMQIGGGGENHDGDLTMEGYIYVDDIKMYNGINCCNSYMQYENTSTLPAVTHVGDYIRAGTDAGIPTPGAPVTVLSNQNVTFRAGSNIFLVPGFSVLPGGTFNASIQDCSPFTHTDNGSMYITNFPNVISPNGDGVNDNFCIKVYNAQEYTIIVSDRKGRYVYINSKKDINSDFVCMWDGSCNQPVCNSGKVSDGVYYVIVWLNNCTSTINQAGDVQVFGNKIEPPNRFQVNNVSTPNKKNVSHTESRQFGVNKYAVNDLVTYSEDVQLKMNLAPNPNKGIFTILFNLPIEAGEIRVQDILGRVILSKQVSENTQTNDISLKEITKGIYVVTYRSEKGILLRQKMIVE